MKSTDKRVNDEELKKLIYGYKSLPPEGKLLIMSNLNVLLVREQLVQEMEVEALIHNK